MAARDPDSLRITFLALDRGESTLVEMPGGYALLCGAGTKEEGPRIVNWLKARGVKKLEGVFIQTWKDTHIGGAPAVLKAFPVGQVLTNPCRVDLPTAKSLDQVAGVLQQKNQLLFTAAIPGSAHVLNYDPFCKVTVAGPTGPMQKLFRKDPNNSMVLEFRLENMAFLNLGDTQRKHQAQLFRQPEEAPWGQVLRIGGGGNADALLGTALKTLKTRVAVIPVARRSGLRPDAGVLAALKKAKIPVYRTDTQGTITITASRRSTEVKTGGARL